MYISCPGQCMQHVGDVRVGQCVCMVERLCAVAVYINAVLVFIQCFNTVRPGAFSGKRQWMKKKWVIYNINSLLMKENNMFNKIPLNSNKIRSMHRLNCCKRPQTRRHKYYFLKYSCILHIFNCHLPLCKFSFYTRMHNQARFCHTNISLPCSATCDTSNLWILSRSIPFTYQCLLFSFRCGGGRDYTLVEKLWTAHYSQCWPGKSLSGHSRPRLHSHVFFF